uniref:Uncharacterized protein n=1 Tax=Stomoxys calcitrans TaxID=35570 RepID=A0A1I8NV35_STOCA
MSTRRSASVGAVPLEKKHFVSRNESTGGVTLDVRCACQFFQSDSLLPERINPVDSRPGSKLEFHHDPQCAGDFSYDEMARDAPAMAPFAAAPVPRHMPMAMPSVSGDRRLLAGERVTLPDPERLSMRSVGKHRSWDQASASVDISFVEKYPELEETAKTRGLVVRSISDDDPHQMPGVGMHHSRQRYTSVDRMSNASGLRDPETMSMHSVRSLRRISRSPSKGDLFVADINIEQPPRMGHRELRSASASRRSSHMDLAATHMPPHINIITPTPLPQASPQAPNFQRTVTPRRSFSQPPAPHDQQGEIDYRYAKPPMTADYMRPEEINKENNAASQNLPGQVLPQNRPIDMSKYRTSDEKSTLVDQSKVGYVQPPPPVSMAPLQPMSTKPYEETVIDITTHVNLVDIDQLFREEEEKARQRAKSPTRPTKESNAVMQSQMDRLSPARQRQQLSPTRQLDTMQGQLFREEEEEKARQRAKSPTRPTMDSNAVMQSQMDRLSPARQRQQLSPTRQLDTMQGQLFREEEEEKTRQRAKSPTRPTKDSNAVMQSQLDRLSPARQRQQLSPTRQLDTLQVPQGTSHQLKRGHSPERQPSPTTTKKMLSEPEAHTTEENAGKTTYSSRFKSLFTSKHKEEDNNLAEPVHMLREKSPSPAPSILRMPSFRSKGKNGAQKEKSPSPAPSAFKMPSIFSKDRNGKQHEKSPSPGPQKSRLMSVFSSKDMPVASTITAGGSSAVMTVNKPKAEMMSIQVHETFSLKVDEMDQYMAKPAKAAAPPPPQAPFGSMPILSKSPSIAKSMSSREDYADSEHVSMSIGEAFAPVIIGRSGSTQLSVDQIHSPPQMASQDRGLQMRSWSKEPVSHTQHSSSEMHSQSWSREPSIHHHPELQGKPLFSAPIMMDSSGSLHQSVSPDRRRQMHGLRSPSEQRPMQLQTKQNFLEGRTQSQDRQGLGGSQDNLSSSRMSKTVSFHFDERKSRLSEFQNRSAQQEPTKRDFLERTYFSRDHEYEPIGVPSTEDPAKSSAIKDQHPANESQTNAPTSEDLSKTAEDFQRQIEDQFFKPLSTSAPTPHMEIAVDTEAEAAAEEAVDEAEPTKSGMKSFMASAQDRTRKMQMGLKTQAGKLRTKFKATPKKSPSSSPKAKERRKFKAPEFSKIKMPEIKRPDMSKFKDFKRPDMSKLKDFKRPEFTKFSKPDMSKFKMPEMSGIKLGRSKSFKESEPTDEDMSVETPEKKGAADGTSPQKKLFDFGNLNFGTYPRVLRKKKKPLDIESSFDTGTATEATSVIPSTTTQPSVESSSSPQGDRGPGPVRSRWADKFSDVSYNDSEGSRYRRYGSEQESFDRESSLERRMREDLEDTVSEEHSMEILGGVADNREFAEFDEENRAIHEISNLRSGEFKRRPMTHQDSDLRSEDDAVGWTEREIQKNILLRKGELEAEASYQRYLPDDGGRHDTHSNASSGKKLVMEEIGEDEFFLRKRGISQDNIEINQYLRSAFRGGDYDKPINTLQHVGQTSDYGDYDVPPPKPRRLHKHFQPTSDSQEFGSYADEYSQHESELFGVPRRPMRKGRSRSKYSMDSQSEVRYMDGEYSHEPSHDAASGVWNDLNMPEKENIPVRHEHRLDADEGDDISRPQPPRRHKRRHDTSMDKDSYINGFGGRSVSNSYLQPTEDVIVYRTEHEYHHVPIATPDEYSPSLSAHKSSLNDDMENGDHHDSQGALSLEQNDQQGEDETDDKYVIEMLENDGYAVVRKDHQIPKPTPPARRKKFAHLPGDRFATMPNMRSKRSTPPPERPPPPRGYTPVSDIVMPSMRKSALSLDARPNYRDGGDYEEPGFNARPESPRNNLQSGDVINKMKYRPLPPPPRPPREKRNRSASKGSEAMHSQMGTDEVDVVDGLEGCETHFEEVEAATQTDPLPDDFVCEEFEITDDMKVIEPRIIPKTIEDMLQEELEKELQSINHQVIDSEQLAKGLQRFRDANQRSLSERSRASSQADRSKSQSRPPTPSAIMVERQSSTPILKDNAEPMLEASLIVRPMDDLELEEEELRREGLLTDESQHEESQHEESQHEESQHEESQHSMLSDYKDDLHVPVSEASYALSSTDIDGALPSDQETQQTDEEVERTLQRYRDELDEIGRQLMETQLTSQEPSPSVSREDMLKDSDREEYSEKWETSDREDQPKEPWQLSDIEEMKSDMEELMSEREDLRSDAEEVASQRLEDEGHKSATEPEAEEEEEEEAPFEKEFTPLPKEYRVDTPTTAAPLPPPRRKSTTAMDQRFEAEDEDKAEEPPVETKEVAVMQTVAKPEQAAPSQLPSHLSDLEVERLRVHALQAGQIMVSQLHGQKIAAEELECQTGNLVVKNIELPPGLIEDIVERVRQTERCHHSTAETQTSQQCSSVEHSPVRDVVPPPKPPRLRDLEATAKKLGETLAAAAPVPIQNADEQTQTDVEATAAATSAPTAANVMPGTLPPPTAFPTAEYLQTLAPLAFYNLHRAQQEMSDQAPRHRRRRSVSPSAGEEPKTGESSDEAPRRRRTRSTRTPSQDDPQSVAKAGRKFITACSLSLAKIINQLTDYMTGKEPKEGVEDANVLSSRHVPALAVLFIVITFCVLIFLLTGRNVHTHHWDYFNPPGQEGRPS